MIGLLSALLLLGFAEEIPPQERTVSRYLPGIPAIESIHAFPELRYAQYWTMQRHPDGFYVLGSQGGVHVFDGERWEYITIPNLAVRGLVNTRNKELYVGGMDEFGLLRIATQQNQQRWRYESFVHRVMRNSLRFGRVHTIHEFPDGKVYFNALYNLLIPEGDSLRLAVRKNYIFRSFYEHGTLFVNDSLGFSTFDGNTVRLLSAPGQFHYTGIHGVLPVDEKTVLFMVNNKGMFQYDGHTITEKPGEVSDYLRSVFTQSRLRLSDGTFMYGTSTHGAVRFDANGTILGLFNKDNGLPENVAYSLLEDNNGSVWIGGFNYLSKVDLAQPVRKLAASTAFNGIIYEYLEHGESIYVAGSDGIYVAPKSASLQFAFKKSLPTQTRSRLLRYKDKVYVYANRFVYDVNGATNDPIYTSNATYARIFVPKASPETWLIARQDGSLIVLDVKNNRFTEWKTPVRGSFEEVEFAENETMVWMASSAGDLFGIPITSIHAWASQHEAEFITYTLPEGWRGEGSRNLSITWDGSNVLIGTPRGLYSIDPMINQVVKDERLGSFGHQDEAGESRAIFQIRADEEGHFWMRSNRKYQFARKRGDATYEIQESVLSSISQNIGTALQSNGIQQAVIVGSDGIYMADLTTKPGFSFRPPLIRNVVSRQDSLLFTGIEREWTNTTQLSLPYRLNDFRVEFASADFSRIGKTMYQVKLDGFEEDWSRWSSDAKKEFTQVREGRYTLLVRARDYNGTISEPARLSIRILPPWYRTWWAYLSYLSMIGAVLYGLHYLRIKRILEIQGIRNHIASDLHDEVSATLSSISFFAEAIERSANTGGGGKFLDLIRQSAGDAKEKITDIIWAINPDNDDWRQLFLKMRRFASDVTDSAGIKAHLSMIDDLPKPVHIELRQQLWLVFKEITTNVARHSGASEVWIDLRFERNRLSLEVRDNGHGFDTSDPVSRTGGGNGLKNIVKRMTSIGGLASVESSSAGTVWHIFFDF